jgi:hypothetical protein
MEITSALPLNRVKHDSFRLTIMSQITRHHLTCIRVFLAAFPFSLTRDERIDHCSVIILQG